MIVGQGIPEISILWQGAQTQVFFWGNYIVSPGFTLNVYPKGIRVFAIYS